MNVRPAYTVSVLVLILFATWRASGRAESHRLRRAGQTGAALAAGLALALAPQIAINLHQSDTLSPLPADTHKLGSVQLTGGLLYQKYETNIDPAQKSPRSQFVDRSTAAFIAERNGAPIDNYRTYLGIVVRSPIAMAAAYLRRIFNGLDVQYPSPLVRDFVKDRSRLRSLLLYSLFFAAANVVLRARRADRSDEPTGNSSRFGCSRSSRLSPPPSRLASSCPRRF